MNEKVRHPIACELQTITCSMIVVPLSRFHYRQLRIWWCGSLCYPNSVSGLHKRKNKAKKTETSIAMHFCTSRRAGWIIHLCMCEHVLLEHEMNRGRVSALSWFAMVSLLGLDFFLIESHRIVEYYHKFYRLTQWKLTAAERLLEGKRLYELGRGLVLGARAVK